MIEHACLILYRSATGLEKALVDVGGGRLILLPAERVRDMWDAWAISAENLPVLAWAMQAQLWDDDWADHTKREWVAAQWEYQALRGTEAGVALALKIMGRDFTGGYDLRDLLVAPQGFFAAPDIPREEWDEWIRQMPELRIQLARKTGLADGEFYVLDGFAGDNHAGRDDGPLLYGRRVILRWPGRPDVDLGMLDVVRDETGEWERISLPGLAGAAFIAGVDVATDERFVDGDEVAPSFYSFQLDPSYDHTSSLLHLSTIGPGLRPLGVEFERVSDAGWGDHFWFVNDIVDEYFADNGRDAAALLADRIFLHDPNVASPMTAGISFAGVDRVDWPPYNAELLIDLITREPGPAWIANETAAEESFAIPDDWSDFNRAMRALKGPGAATSLRDKIMADFDVMHPLRFGEPILVNPDTRFGDHRPSWL